MTQDTEDVAARVRQAILKGAFNNDPQWQAMATAAAIAAIEVLQPDRQSLSDRIDGLTEALNVFVRSAYPVATEINERGHNWCEAYLDEALTIARAALHQEGIAP